MFAESYFLLWIALGMIAITIVVAIFWADPAANKINARVAEFEEQFGRRQGRLAGRTLRHGGTPSFFVRLASLILSTQSKSETLQVRLAKGGIYNPSASTTYLGVQMILTAAPLVAGGVGVGALEWSAKIAGSACIAAVVCGRLLPRLWLDSVVRARHVMLRRSLPDFLDLMIVCLQGGLSVQETIRRVSDELRLAHPALAGELSIVQRDVEFGATVDHALRRFAIRSDYDGVRTLSSFVRESQKFGTQLTEALRLHADMLRLQREEAAEEKAQKAAVAILLPTLLLIFPVVFVVLVGPALIQIQEAFVAK